MKTSSLFISLLFSTLATFAAAQDYSNVKQDSFLKDYVSKNWTAANGLPGNTITDLMQDNTGYLYFGTYDGLVRFDGVEFVTFNKIYNPKCEFSSARSIKQDSKGNIWVGANDEGVTKLYTDGTTKSFTISDGLPNNSIRTIEEDHDGNIWIGTAAGVVYITPDEKIVHPNGLENYGEDKILVSYIFCDSAGRIWLTSAKENGLFVFSNGIFEPYKRISSVEKPIVTYVTQDNTGALWFGISPHYAVKIANNTERLYNIGQTEKNGTVINSIYQDKKSNIWFAMDAGVTVLHEGEFSYLNTTNGLSDDKVAKVIEDREGNIWFATDRSGIQRLSLSKFKTTKMQTTVNAICEDEARGIVWIGADDGLYCVKNDNFIENKLTNLCKKIRIRDIKITNHGEVLVSTYEKLGLVRMDKDENIQTWTKDDGLTGNKVRVSIDAKNEDLYVGTTTGLNVIDHTNGIITKITKEKGIPNDYIMCLFEDADGRIWCGTDGGGIFILNKGILEKVYTTEDGLAGNVIFKISEIKKGEIWIFTGSGASVYNQSKDSFFNIDSSAGIGVDGIFQGIIDYTGKIWMTSNKGVFCVKDEEIKKYENGVIASVNSRYFGQSDGLNSNGVTSTSRAMKDSIGRIWFPLIDGYSIYNPLKVTANETVPLIKIQEITIDAEKKEFDGNPIVLEPGTKRVSMKFTGLSFISSEHMKFRTKLNGFDTDYSDWSTLRTVSYTNLPHGTYRFTFQAKNSDEISSAISDEILVIKKPFIWEVVGFWIAIGIFIVGIIALIILHRFRSMKKYQVKLEKEVEARTHDLKLEKEKSENLLLNILPMEVAKELTEKPEETIAKKYPNATVLFTDIVGFSKISGSLTADETVRMLNEIVSRFDQRAKREGVEKIKTIGDAYMAATGLTENAKNNGAVQMIQFAQGLLEDVDEYNRKSTLKIQIRIGVNTGNLVAGVIGKSKFIYDIWGDTVNVASRMESSGVPMNIHVTENTFNATKENFRYSQPSEIDIKGKGMMKTYYIEQK